MIDFASDHRAPTPTAAAERAVPVRAELLARLEETEGRRISAMRASLNYRGEKLRDLSRALPRREALLAQSQQRLDLASARLPNALSARINLGRAGLSQASGALRPSLLSRSLQGASERVNDRATRLAPALERKRKTAATEFENLAKRFDTIRFDAQIEQRRQKLSDTMHRFKQAAHAEQTQHARKLDALDRLRLTLGYKATLDRGYAVVRSSDGDVLTTQKAAKSHAALDIEFADGVLSLGTGRVPKPAKSKTEPKDQGSLF